MPRRLLADENTSHRFVSACRQLIDERQRLQSPGGAGRRRPPRRADAGPPRVTARCAREGTVERRASPLALRRRSSGPAPAAPYELVNEIRVAARLPRDLDGLGAALAVLVEQYRRQADRVLLGELAAGMPGTSDWMAGGACAALLRRISKAVPANGLRPTAASNSITPSA